jgi:putative ABC transport system permease protein
VVPLARRTLFHDKARLMVTICGVVVAVLLVTVQLGLLLGFATSTTSLIDNSGADLWIAPVRTPNVDIAAPLPERWIYHVLGEPGVADARRMIVYFVNWKRPDGGTESAAVVGMELGQPMGQPWNVVKGNTDDLGLDDSVFIDELYLEKLGVHGIGDRVEINGRRARVAGLTSGIRSFTTSPYIFTNLRNAREYARLADDEVTYFVVKLQPGADVEEVRASLARRMPNCEVLTSPAFARRTQIYWMVETGAGMTLAIAAIMGIIVGIVVVSQTIYATTMDHLKEYGTLKAIGASNRFVSSLIVRQAAWVGTIGYGLGMLASLVPVHLSESQPAVVLLPWQLAAVMFVLTIGMCIIASLTSINKVMRTEPALVFRG